MIDDDPTGSQTVYGIPLLAKWDYETIAQEFRENSSVFYLLTNSRSLTKEESTSIYEDIAAKVKRASEETGRGFSIVSRSDSTLRGHFYSEIEAIKTGGNFIDSIIVFLPVMFEGGRVTCNSEHYITEKANLIAVNQTPFALDHTFGYKNSNLKKYIEEKTNGHVAEKEVFNFSINTIRTQSVEQLCNSIMAIEPGRFCISDALNYNDLDKISHAFLQAEKLGKSIIYRTSSSFVPSYIGLKPKHLLAASDLLRDKNTAGGLTIVGSYVPKSSAQLHEVLKLYDDETTIELNVEEVLGTKSQQYISGIILKIDQLLHKGKNVIVFTSRKLITGENELRTINIASSVSEALISIVKNSNVRPKYLLAKGGITSNDIAIKGLGMKRSIVLGQIEAGIPVWEMGEETKHPKLTYIVFPGNVGNENSLLNITQKLNNQSIKI